MNECLCLKRLLGPLSDPKRVSEEIYRNALNAEGHRSVASRKHNSNF